MDSDPADMFVLYYNILISMKGQLNVNTLWLGMDLSMAIHIMSQRQNYVIVNFHLEFRWGIYETDMGPEDPSNRKNTHLFC